MRNNFQEEQQNLEGNWFEYPPGMIANFSDTQATASASILRVATIRMPICHNERTPEDNTGHTETWGASYANSHRTTYCQAVFSLQRRR